MGTWVSATELAEQAHRRLLHLPPGETGFREQAARLAIATWGQGMVLQLPALINWAGLALRMRDRLVVHRLSAGAIRLVHETDLHSLPGEPPRLLRKAWIVESRKLDEPLFGATVGLAGYELEGAIYLLGLDYPDGAYVSRWRPRWEERELEATVEVDTSPLIADVDTHFAWSKEAARFAVVLGLLLDAEGTPVVVEDRSAGKPRKVPVVRSGAGGWVTRYVYLGRERRLPAAPGRRPAAAVVGEGKENHTKRGVPEHLVAQTVPVSGHLKRQPYGPGMGLRKWIHVAGYEARRWVAPRPLRIEIRA